MADKPEITGVELLFFLYDRETKALLDAEWKVIVEYGRRFTYTVHLPDQVKPEYGELIERFLPLARYFIVHPYPPEAAETQERLLSSWAGRYGKGDKTLFSGNPFLIENTVPGRQEALLRWLPSDTGLCMDTGHLLLEGKNPVVFFTIYQNRLGEIHLHDLDPGGGARDGKRADHRPLDARKGWLKELLPRLRGFSGVINLELFSWDEIFRSMGVLKEFGLIP
ncbi:MAG: AP endonuclease [Spirochaetaceae bacterium]|nr:AP endonuclease [Spirochaetaceae bacterium]